MGWKGKAKKQEITNEVRNALNDIVQLDSNYRDIALQQNVRAVQNSLSL